MPPKIPELLSPEDNIPRSQKRKKRRGSKSSQESVKASSGDDGKHLNGDRYAIYQLQLVLRRGPVRIISY